MNSEFIDYRLGETYRGKHHSNAYDNVYNDKEYYFKMQAEPLIILLAE